MNNTTYLNNDRLIYNFKKKLTKKELDKNFQISNKLNFCSPYF